MSQVKRVLNLKADPHDPRDRPLSALQLKSPPKSASVMDPRIVPNDQKSTGSCVGQATCKAARIAYLVGNKVDCPELSPLYTYAKARLIDGQTQLDDTGTYLRSAVKALQKFGISAESKWKFSESRVNKAPNWTADHDAYQRRGIRGYYRIAAGDVTGVKSAIAAGKPVIGGWQVDQSYLDYTGGILDECVGPSLGGHANAILGYDDDTFDLLNSWGINYGERGHLRVTAAFVAAGTDLWAIDV